MQKKMILFVVALTVCLSFTAAGHITAAAGTVSPEDAPLPTSAPKQTIQQNENAPLPEFWTDEIVTGETVEYFEADDGSIWKVISTIEWVAPKTKSAMKTAGDYEEKVLSFGRIYKHQINPFIEYTVATVHSSYTVQYYTNENKVHLCGRTHTSTLCDSSYSIQLVYGKIVNTDGSISYTSGDKLNATKNGNEISFDINFVVTPTTYSFD